MRRLLALAFVLALAGCIETGVNAIEESREDARERRGDESARAPPAAASNDGGASWPWPREGSHATWRIEEAHGPADARNVSTSEATWTWHDGDWRGVCVQRWRVERHDGAETGERARTMSAAQPPHWPLFMMREPEAAVRAWYVADCHVRSGDARHLGVAPHATRLAAPRAGDVEAHQADGDVAVAWDTRTGLVLSWDAPGSRGRLVSTDAPMAWR